MVPFDVQKSKLQHLLLKTKHTLDVFNITICKYGYGMIMLIHKAFDSSCFCKTSSFRRTKKILY